MQCECQQNVFLHSHQLQSVLDSLISLLFISIGFSSYHRIRDYGNAKNKKIHNKKNSFYLVECEAIPLFIQKNLFAHLAI